MKTSSKLQKKKNLISYKGEEMYYSQNLMMLEFLNSWIPVYNMKLIIYTNEHIIYLSWWNKEKESTDVDAGSFHVSIFMVTDLVDDNCFLTAK